MQKWRQMCLSRSVQGHVEKALLPASFQPELPHRTLLLKSIGAWIGTDQTMTL